MNCRIENTATNIGGTPGWHLKGIFCNYTPRVVIANNVIRGWSQAIGLWWGVSNALVQGNQILDNYGFEDDAHTIHRSAVEDYGASEVNFGNRFFGNTVIGSTAQCFEIASGVVGSVYQGNQTGLPGRISDYGDHFNVTGVLGEPTTDVVIEGNTSVSDGVRAESGVSVNGLAYRTHIIGNSFTGFNHRYAQGAVFIGGTVGVEDVMVESNSFYDCNYPVRVNISYGPVVIRGNIIRKANAIAIWVDSGDGHVIEDNDIEAEPFATGVKLTAGARHQVVGNRIKAGYMGILCMTGNNSITGNTVEETMPYKVGVVRLCGPNARNNDLRLNTLTAAPGSRALLIDAGADYNAFLENTVVQGTLVIAADAGVNNVVQAE
jgi:hypothetical protein